MTDHNSFRLDFTNNLYQSGGHCVLADLSNPPSQPVVSQSRHSIVFIMRADWSTPILYSALTSQITGRHPSDRVEGEMAGALFIRIKRAHFSVNINPKERAKQKRKLAEKKRAQLSAIQQTTPEEEKVKDGLN
jgi:hypothetical protein